MQCEECRVNVIEVNEYNGKHICFSCFKRHEPDLKVEPTMTCAACGTKLFQPKHDCPALAAKALPDITTDRLERYLSNETNFEDFTPALAREVLKLRQELDEARTELIKAGAHLGQMSLGLDLRKAETELDLLRNSPPQPPVRIIVTASLTDVGPRQDPWAGNHPH